MLINAWRRPLQQRSRMTAPLAKQKGWDDIYGGIHIDPACDIEGTKGRACCVAINPKRGAPAIQERTK